jgi:protein-S-isoprenylcysteine O-methyltransferase Ste14
MAIGALISAAGLSLRGLASGHVEKNEQLTKTGPYAYTRNPLYLGSLIMAAGFAVAARSWWVAAGMVAIFIAIYVPVIRSEEDFLRGNFPEFQEYSAQVPRLLPRFRASASSGGEFSWALYRKHREYKATLGTAGIYALLLLKLLWID